MAQATFSYETSITSAICDEVPSSDNPFVAQSRRVYGYDIGELTQQAGFVETLCLLFTGELPRPDQAKMLERCLIGLITLGPRDSATRASMVAGVSKSHPQHLLPVGLMVGGGERQGAAEVAQAHRFISRHRSSEAIDVLSRLDLPEKCPPGFGQRCGSIDPLMQTLLEDVIAVSQSCRVLNWVSDCHDHLSSHQCGILDTGIIASVCVSLGIGERESIGLYQIARAPGLFAHGVEQSHKPITAIPMIRDEEVHLER